jgi:hypothetical protein
MESLCGIGFVLLIVFLLYVIVRMIINLVQGKDELDGLL